MENLNQDKREELRADIEKAIKMIMNYHGIMIDTIMITNDDENGVSVKFKDENILRAVIGAEYGGLYQERNFYFEDLKIIISSYDGEIKFLCKDKVIDRITGVFPARQRMTAGAWEFIIKNFLNYKDESDY